VTRRLTALLAAFALAAVPLAGCGKKEPGIPRDDASQLIRLLRQAREQADDPQSCDELQATVRRVAAKVRALPDKTDGDVRDSLRNGVRNLASSARAQCRKEKPPKTTTETTPTETTPTETTPTETTPTETTPTETTPPPTTPPTTPPPTTPVPTTPGTGGQTPGNNGNGKGGGKKKDKHEKKKHGGKR
jgi:hypothetical protein